MKGLVVKLACGTARLAFWRKPVEAGTEPAAPVAATPSATIAAPDSVPKPSWFARLKQTLRRRKEHPAPAPVADPARDADAPSVEMDAVDTAPAQIAQLEVAHIEAEPATIAPAVPSQIEAPPAAPPSVEITQADHSESQNPKLVSRVLGTLSKKRVWIPSVSVAMLAVMGTLSFMLMQSKQATHELQAELARAKKQLKHVPIKPQLVPPLLVAHQDVAPHGVNPAAASPQAVSREDASLQAAAGSSPSPNVDMDCDISDKASVGKNLRNCIEAFNQATAR